MDSPRKVLFDSKNSGFKRNFFTHPTQSHCPSQESAVQSLGVSFVRTYLMYLSHMPQPWHVPHLAHLSCQRSAVPKPLRPISLMKANQPGPALSPQSRLSSRRITSRTPTTATPLMLREDAPQGLAPLSPFTARHNWINKYTEIHRQTSSRAPLPRSQSRSLHCLYVYGTVQDFTLREIF